jgi:hypothetical protein
MILIAPSQCCDATPIPTHTATNNNNNNNNNNKEEGGQRDYEDMSVRAGTTCEAITLGRVKISSQRLLALTFLPVLLCHQRHGTMRMWELGTHDGVESQ